MKYMRAMIAALVLASASVFALAVTQEGSQKDAAPKTRVAQKQQAKPQDEGQRVFEQNCSRCHTAPEGFSTRISGTIVRHMRVRASLSAHDEEELLHFFNP